MTVLGAVLRRGGRWGVALACLVALAPSIRAAESEVVIHEIHYHPPEGEIFEFVELHNAGLEPVDLGGWAFLRGIRHEFAPGTGIPAGGFLVLCRYAEAAADLYGLPRGELVEWADSVLDNAGETLLLVDDQGRTVDEVPYDDDLPWPVAADGLGPSLQRRCADADSRQPTTWTAQAGQAPTPLAPNVETLCPPPPLPPPEIAIQEIHYHPYAPANQDKDPTEEFVELVNASDRPIDLLGYCFTQGIRFCFTEPLVLGPGEIAVVCRNREEAMRAYGLAESQAVGDFEGQLSNDGERITLVDPQGRLADSVRYGETGDWSPGADGLGYSLEKIRADAVSDDPASWSDSGDVVSDPNVWKTVTTTGVATSSKFYLYASDEGEFLIDELSLVRLDEPDVNLLPDGEFREGVEGWELLGNHEGSRWSQSPDGGPVFDEAALHLIATGRGSTRNCLYVEIVPELDRSPDVSYRLTFSYRHLAGSDGLTARLSISTPSRGIYISVGGNLAQTSAGSANRSARSELPPFITDLRRDIQEPGSEDPVVITARVGGDPDQVLLIAQLSDGEETFPIVDDGRVGDGGPGDGVYGVELPPQPHNTAVKFRIEASSVAGVRLSPSGTDPSLVHGYYVNDYRPDSPLPIHQLLIPSTSPRSWIAGLGCDVYRACDFAYEGDLYPNVEIRRRGGSVCGQGDVIKKYFKIRFRQGHYFQRLRKLNFQSLYTDKALVREHMAWELFDEMTNPYCFHDYTRVHCNGQYFGLYAALEHPDGRFLSRNGLDPQGNLYKATASREEATGTYEKESNENGDYSDLRDFLSTMHATRTADLVSFFHERVNEDVVIDYQASQVLTNNRDYPHKNHFLYHDPQTGKWMPITWDMDLTYGKLWDGNFHGVLNDRQDNPGITPWHTTNVRGGGLGNHLLDKFFYQAGAWYRRAYLVRLWNAIHEKYTVEFYEAKISALHDLLYEEQDEDIRAWGRSPATANDPTAPAEFEPNLDRVRQHIAVRRNYLINFLRTTERFEGSPRLKITEILYNPRGDDAAEFLELWNNSGEAIDVSGWTIQGLDGLDLEGNPGEFRFPDETTVEENEVLIVAKDPELFGSLYSTEARVFGPYPGNLSNGGEVLRVKDAGPGYPATVDLVPYETGGAWPREPDGIGASLELFDVEADLDNDPPTAWRASRPGGTPGHVAFQGAAILYRRGDSNVDGTTDFTDALVILGYLFQRGDVPDCLEAGDLDADGRLSVTDAIILLRYLFVEEPVAIPPPGPDDACEPAPEGSCRVSNC